MQADITGNQMVVPEQFGQGCIKAVSMPFNASVMVGEITPVADLALERTGGTNAFYSLQFTEVLEEKPQTVAASKQQVLSYLDNSFIALANGQLEAKNVIRAGTRLRFVLVIFERKHLAQFFEESVIDLFLGTYFAQQLQKGHFMPIDADYRLLMQQLMEVPADDPLCNNYITTRCMLLLERFITRFMQRAEAGKPLSIKTADEINRLMRVESKLVRDYTQPPPTIDVLSKAAAMSPTKLKKDFKQLYGLPIYEYYQKNRMRKAHTLLSGNNYSIKEVGIMVGYTNLSHFAVSFKKEFGVLPSELLTRDEVLPMGEPDL
ncbi:transcriptional regulator, AraC family [Filimonas lacunae]|nr:transcriptional regulator, AraC family [Filimonas lacunae]